VVDIKRSIAVREARKIGIPVVGLVDTDCDPSEVDIAIPGNDDAYRAIQQVLRALTDSIIAGRDKYVTAQAELEKARLEEEARRAAEDEAAKKRAAEAKREAAEKAAGGAGGEAEAK
jgi:small subunit ribosomal protein S2